MNPDPDAHVSRDGDARAWIEQSTSIHVIVKDRYGDPVEMTAQEAKAFADALRDLAERLETLDLGLNPS